ncbi:GT4 family glycosyltransferase PelF [Legionella waltersii]|uniref:GDP-mannose-dependent alpha-(1-2)-phosphatidylinositol mannosyltransferase n=1 Tax=Legionella waltersii TaxID=66969 RepID=A0A0W1A501_9GAMM|nr:GT4 family glycosyltransferase PelF [Legionella waltersii]KTD76288.1 GDP-mannose-dependent alpha-(1-2)-phosphatidylinositol mannosyltransferase [Legionella waltersii]SNV13444.1 D-inositol-3-phosphate glycosyltransferase [Legionella waltersii]
MIETILSAKEVDILMIAEGTYPFVRGGVGSWVSDIVHQLPQYRFGILFLGACKGMYKELVYPVPSNVLHLQMIYLFETRESNEKVKPVEPSAILDLYALHDNLRNSHHQVTGLQEPLVSLDRLMCPHLGIDFNQFKHSEESWNFITEKYSQYSTDPSFINYFWNIRNMHEPLWSLHSILNHLPEFRLIHPISTGYAGLLSVMIKQKYQKAILLTEHGLYTKERNIELLQSPMLIDSDPLLTDKKIFSYQHDLWLRFFSSMARMTYQEASYIVSLYSGAQKQQIAAGADPAKAMVIGNGINIETYKPLRRLSPEPILKTVCFVGRMVRIKDIKTIVRAIYYIYQKDKDIKGFIKIVGDPDEDYLEECVEYINLLGLEQVISFIEEGGMVDALSKSGLLLLSSISEGMPLVILESLAAGVPVIATDVGACRDIIEGFDEEDRAMGQAGAVVSVSNANTIAKEALNLLLNPGLWYKAQQVGIQRVEKYYALSVVISRYLKLYNEILAWQE